MGTEMRAKVRRIVDFVKADVWRIRSHTLPPSKWFLIRQLRIILLALRGFRADKCSLRASALTFYSILAIVPVFAMAFGVAKGFGMDEKLEERLTSALAGHEDVATKVIDFSSSLLENASGGLLAGAGIVLLFWTVLKLLGNIEKSFNEIWGIKKGRPLARKFADYLSIVLICPVLLVVSGSATVVVMTKVRDVVEGISFLGFLGPLIFALLRLLPYAIGWALFAFIYVFMPNTKVNLRSGILAGVVAGTIYQIIQWGYISFQVGVTKYGAIYGSFAVLPLFLIWLQVTWLVVLFGAELSFAHQNVGTYEFEPDCLEVSSSFKRLLGLRIAHLIVRNFAQGKQPATATDVSHEVGTPIRLVNEVLYDLVQAAVLSETRGEDERETAYQPARAIDTLTVAHVIESLEQTGSDNIPLIGSEDLNRLSECLRDFREAITRSPSNLLLRDV